MRSAFLIPVFLIARLFAASELTICEMIAPNPFVISKEKVDEITLKKGISVHQLLQELVPVAKLFARPQISYYQVGIAALGKSGNIYLGANLEFAGQPLNEAVHGEQFLVVNARNYGEKELVAIALSAAPCGHCRQFLHEMGVSDNLLIITPGAVNKTLTSLLPESFGPQDLGLPAALMQVAEGIAAYKIVTSFDPQDSDKETSSLAEKALQAASASYAPYSKSKSGVAIQTKDGSIYTGSYLENAAFNPSLSPLQVALVALVVGRKEYRDITHVILAEQQSPKVSQEVFTHHIVKNLSPGALFEKIILND